MSSLKDAITAYQVSFREKVPTTVQELMKSVTADLKAAKLTGNTLQVGDTFPAFTLFDTQGKKVDASLFKEQDFTIINFYRGGWCPYCNLELKALQTNLNIFSSLNAKLISISPQTVDHSLLTAEKNALTFPVLSDPNNTLAKACGLVFVLPESLRPIYASFGIDVANSNGEDSFELPMPASFIIDAKGVIRYAFVDEDYTLRIEPDTLVDALKTLAG